MSSEGRSGRPALASLVAAAILVAAACGTSAPTPASPTYTAYAIGPTAWPNGTVGQYGLRIDPTLLRSLPASVLGLPIKEDAASEAGALSDKDLPNNFDGYAAAALGTAGNDPDWLNIVIGRLKPNKSDDPDFYEAWVTEFAMGACSKAGGVASSGQQTINARTVDTATCGGGPVVYTWKLDNGLLVSIWGLGPRDLGRKLIMSLN